jgi:Asp-tRNA(Asn)/Glu-tRNA(Gln) amidotransferase A subunit family amidase
MAGLCHLHRWYVNSFVLGLLKLTSVATGSVRIPALLNGCFGLRPSTNSIPTDGIVSVYPGFDTPGFLGRDLNRFHNFASIWYGEHLNGTTIRKPKIVVPIDFLATINGKQLELTESFISDLERALDTVAERRSIAADWVQTSPVDEKNIDTYLQNASRSLSPNN